MLWHNLGPISMGFYNSNIHCLLTMINVWKPLKYAYTPMLWCLLFITIIISCSTCNDYLVFMGKFGQPWGEFTNLAAQVLEEEFFIRSSSMARLAKGLRDSWGHLCYSFCCTDASSILRHRQSCWVLVSKSWRAIFASLEKYVLPFRR